MKAPMGKRIRPRIKPMRRFFIRENGLVLLVSLETSVTVMPILRESKSIRTMQML